MTDVREFRLLGRSDLDHVRSKVERALATWSARWFQSSEVPQLAALEVALDARADGVSWRMLHSPAGGVYIALQPKTASRLLNQWLVGEGDIQGARAGADEEWCTGFVVGLMQDLMASVAAIPSPQPHNTKENTSVDLPDVFAQSTSGAVYAFINFSGEQLLFALSPEFVKYLLKDGAKAATGPGSPRVSAGEALVSVPMRLKVGAWMEESLTIDALHGLAVGDVLVLGRKLEEPWPVIAPNGSTVAQCYLGHQGTQQVIKLINASKEPHQHAK